MDAALLTTSLAAGGTAFVLPAQAVIFWSSESSCLPKSGHTTLVQPQNRGPGQAGNTPQAIPAQLFCFRYAVTGANQLQIRDIVATCFDDKARDILQRDYHRTQEDTPASHKSPRR